MQLQSLGNSTSRHKAVATQNRAVEWVSPSPMMVKSGGFREWHATGFQATPDFRLQREQRARLQYCSVAKFDETLRVRC